MGIHFIYITASSMDEARRIGKELVSERLAACVNIINNIQSFYWWEGKLQDDTEVAMIAKTTEEFVPKLIEKVKALHSYSCPCIVSLPIVDGHKAFLEWVSESVAAHSS